MIRGFFDGASRGNPGQAGAGACIFDGGRALWRRAVPLGTHTNNEAEYMALDILTKELERRGIRGAEICGDSKLVISQVTGAWKIKEPRLAALAAPVIARVRSLGASCRWVPREQNKEADRLSNIALDDGDFTESDGAAPAREERPTARAAGVCEARRVDAHIWIVRDGTEEFAVDTAHSRCTCPDGHGGRCRHIEAVAAERIFSND